MRKMLPDSETGFVHLLRFLLLSLAISGALSACTYDYAAQETRRFLRTTELATHHRISRTADWVLSSATELCLVNPYTAGYDEAPRTQQQLAQALTSALLEHFVVRELPLAPGDLHTLTNTAIASGCGVMLLPRLVRSADGLNSWSELNNDLLVDPSRGPAADKLVLQIAIFDPVSRRLLDIASIHSETGFWTLSPRMPADMFEQAMREYAMRISGRPQPTLATY